MLVAAALQLSPSKLVQFLKGRSSRMLQREFPALRKRYWGQHLWGAGLQGLPYQTLISSLLHKYASGYLKEV